MAYRSFRECFEKNLLPNGFLQSREVSNIVSIESTPEKDYSKKIDFYKPNGLFTYFAQLEKEYECNSICEPNLFYIHEQLQRGVPHVDCLKKFNESWGSDVGNENYGEIGAALAITAGVFLILASCCSIHKCNGFGYENLKRRYKYKDDYI